MSNKSLLHSSPQRTLHAADRPTLRFVLRRHQATHLQWELLVEANGVVYSWRMYQPPSVNPLRVVGAGLCELSDSHGMSSEGVIPDGEPGAGPTLVEEFGWLTPLTTSNLCQARAFEKRYREGRIELWLEGCHLRGGFVLEGRGTQWRVRKVADEFASTTEPEWTGVSALSGRTLDDLLD